MNLSGRELYFFRILQGNDLVVVQENDLVVSDQLERNIRIAEIVADCVNMKSLSVLKEGIRFPVKKEVVIDMENPEDRACQLNALAWLRKNTVDREQQAMNRSVFECDALAWLAENTVYRGQWCGCNALRSNLPTFAFGTCDVARIYSEDPNDKDLVRGQSLLPQIFEAKLDVSKIYCVTVLENPDPFIDLDAIGIEFGRDVMNAVIRDYADSIEVTCAFLDLEEKTGLRTILDMAEDWPGSLHWLPPVPGYLALRVPEFIEALQCAGYDAVAIGGSGETALKMEWHVFDAARAVCPQSGEPLPRYGEMEVETPSP